MAVDDSHLTSAPCCSWGRLLRHSAAKT